MYKVYEQFASGKRMMRYYNEDKTKCEEWISENKDRIDCVVMGLSELVIIRG